MCNGQLLPISQNAALFALLGTYYGGDGRSTFALPNLQGNYPMHSGNGAGLSPRVLGESGGEAAVTLLTAAMPAHTHNAACVAAGGGTDSPTGAVWADAHSGKAPVLAYKGNSTNSNTTMNSQTLNLSGGNQPHNNLSPYLALTFIIAMQGIFPARN